MAERNKRRNAPLFGRNVSGDGRRSRPDQHEGFGSKDFRSRRRGAPGFRHEGPRGHFDDRRRQGRDNPKEMPWAGRADASQNGAWTHQENKRLAEEFGSNSNKLQPGKMDFFSEKNIWEKSKGNAGNGGLLQGFGPAQSNPNNRQGPPPLGQHLLPTPPPQVPLFPHGPPPLGQHPPPINFGRDDCPGYDRYKRRSPGFNQFDQGNRRENAPSDGQPSDEPQFGRQGESDQAVLDRYGRRSPTPSSTAAGSQENLSGGPTGVLVKRLADCCVKSENDAKLASDVISVLMKSLKEYHHKIGDPNAVLLIDEANVKFNIMRTLQSSGQPGALSGEQCPPQNGARPPYNPPGPVNFPPQRFDPTTCPPSFPLGQLRFSAPPFGYK